MFDEKQYEWLKEKYKELHYHDTDTDEEWNVLAKEMDEVRLEILNMLVGDIPFDEIRRKLNV